MVESGRPWRLQPESFALLIVGLVVLAWTISFGGRAGAAELEALRGTTAAVAPSAPAEPLRSHLVPPLDELAWEGTSHVRSEVRKKSIVRNGELEHVMGFSYARLPPGASVERHAHGSKAEVFHVTGGSGRALVWAEGAGDAAPRAEFALRTGSTVVLHPRESHSFTASADEALDLLYFGVDA